MVKRGKKIIKLKVCLLWCVNNTVNAWRLCNSCTPSLDTDGTAPTSGKDSGKQKKQQVFCLKNMTNVHQPSPQRQTTSLSTVAPLHPNTTGFTS